MEMSGALKVWYSVVAALAGWLAGALVAGAHARVFMDGLDVRSFFVTSFLAAILEPLFIGPAWLVIVLPTAVLVRRTTWFWNPWMATLSGAAIGVLLMATWLEYSDIRTLESKTRPAFVIAAAFTGGTTYLVLARKLRIEAIKPPPPVDPTPRNWKRYPMGKDQSVGPVSRGGHPAPASSFGIWVGSAG